MLETIKEQIKSTLENFYQLKYEQEIGIVVEEPKNPELGDISIPIFRSLNIISILFFGTDKL